MSLTSLVENSCLCNKQMFKHEAHVKCICFAPFPGLGPGFILLVKEEGEGEDPLLCFGVDVAVLEGPWWAWALKFSFLVFSNVDDDAVTEVSLLLLSGLRLEENIQICYRRNKCCSLLHPHVFFPGQVLFRKFIDMTDSSYEGFL